MKMTTSENDSNGDIYTRMAHIPALVHNHLDVVQHRSDGGLLLAASSLTGRYWAGSLWFFDKAENAPDVEKCGAGVDLDSGVNDFKLLSDTKLLLGTDTGVIQVWELNDTEATLTRTSEQDAHDSYVLSVSTSTDSKHAVTSSEDKSIKLWDLEAMTNTNTYTAHYGAVTQVACHPTEPEMFLSCGQDGRLIIWDTRKPKPAAILDASSLKSQATAVAWQPGKQCTFAVGSEGGAIGLFDHSNRDATPSVLKPHTRIVHRLAFSPEKPDWLASVSDDCQVAVSDFAARNITWKSDLHKDFARGVSWNPTKPDNLVTCGWDFHVHSHTVTPQPVSMEAKTVAADEDMDTLSPS